MAQIESTNIHQDIEIIVSEKLQVVSYKWLSRNYMVSSNAAKTLLQEFVEKHESELQVVYVLSGWLKSDPSSYHIRLVSGLKLSEAKQDFSGNCSVHVYSVQACIPKDSTALWNAEFVQTEELFKQPFTVENCLRDNRFSGISNSFVKRKAEGLSMNIDAQPKVTASKSDYGHQNTSIPQSREIKVEKSGQNVGLQSLMMVKKEIKVENDGPGTHCQASKPLGDKEKAPSLPVSKKNVQTDKISSSTGGSLANLWGRASSKPKPDSVIAEVKNAIPDPTVSSVEAQIFAHEAIESVSSDDDGQNVNFRRASNGEGRKKRRVVFDFSDDDEFEDAVNLASPNNPKEKSCQDANGNTKPLVSEKAHENSNQMGDKPKVKEEIVTDKEFNQASKEDSPAPASPKKDSKPSNAAPISSNDSKPTSAAPTSPKRRKVLKTRIDERGREVTEVIWEGDDVNKENVCVIKKGDHDTVKDTVTRPPAVAKKPPAQGNINLNPTGKAGTKKAGNSKDPKQGNILSFFKKV